jgi:hypothetical protein
MQPMYLTSEYRDKIDYQNVNRRYWNIHELSIDSNHLTETNIITLLNYIEKNVDDHFKLKPQKNKYSICLIITIWTIFIILFFYFS